MTSERFNELVKKQFEKCEKLLCSKNKEYATDDTLHNFKVAAKLQGCNPVTALAGMMCKHTVSVYDLIRDNENGKHISPEMWDEKICDSMNYLLLLIALLEEQKEGEKAVQSDGEPFANLQVAFERFNSKRNGGLSNV